MAKIIMFSDRYDLTRAVLEGRKTMTRRFIPDRVIEGAHRGLFIAPKELIPENMNFEQFARGWSRHPSNTICLYSDLGDGRLKAEYLSNELLQHSRFKVGDKVSIAQSLQRMGYDPKDNSNGNKYGLDHAVAWTNKMFVAASQCVHRIVVTEVRVERLQDITDEDAMREGIKTFTDQNGNLGYTFDQPKAIVQLFSSPRKAFAAFIDKVYGKGSWESNPYCFTYSFELVT